MANALGLTLVSLLFVICRILQTPVDSQHFILHRGIEYISVVKNTLDVFANELILLAFSYRYDQSAC